MANAYKDENGVNTMIGSYYSGGNYSINRVVANPSTGAISVNDASTGNYPTTVNAAKDANDVSVLLAVSSVDGKTPVEVYVSPTGMLLINSN